MTLLILTRYIAALIRGAGRTTVLQGAAHLVIFATFMLVSAVPEFASGGAWERRVGGSHC